MAKPWLAAKEIPLSTVPPVLITVNVCAAETDASPWMPKFTCNGEKVTARG